MTISMEGPRIKRTKSLSFRNLQIDSKVLHHVFVGKVTSLQAKNAREASDDLGLRVLLCTSPTTQVLECQNPSLLWFASRSTTLCFCWSVYDVLLFVIYCMMYDCVCVRVCAFWMYIYIYIWGMGQKPGTRTSTATWTDKSIWGELLTQFCGRIQYGKNGKPCQFHKTVTGHGCIPKYGCLYIKKRNMYNVLLICT